jgi:CRP-like cAMP-binding protein
MSSCREGKVVYAPGDQGEVLFLLKKGRVDIYGMNRDGKKLLIAEVEPGTLFGEMSLTGSSMVSSFAEAREDSLLCVIRRRDLEGLMTRFPSIGIHLLGHMATRVRELERRLEEEHFHNMRSRIALELRRLSEQRGSAELDVTHQQIADRLATYRETVSVALGELQRRGCIRLGRGRITIVDNRALAGITAVYEGSRDVE